MLRQSYKYTAGYKVYIFTQRILRNYTVAHRPCRSCAFVGDSKQTQIPVETFLFKQAICNQSEFERRTIRGIIQGQETATPLKIDAASARDWFVFVRRFFTARISSSPDGEERVGETLSAPRAGYKCITSSADIALNPKWYLPSCTSLLYDSSLVNLSEAGRSYCARISDASRRSYVIEQRPWCFVKRNCTRHVVEDVSKREINLTDSRTRMCRHFLRQDGSSFRVELSWRNNNKLSSRQMEFATFFDFYVLWVKMINSHMYAREFFVKEL